MLVGVDTGGTFTDVVAVVGGRVRVLKLRSTPADPAEAVREALARIARDGRPLVPRVRVGVEQAHADRLRAETAHGRHRAGDGG